MDNFLDHNTIFLRLASLVETPLALSSSKGKKTHSA